jgi:hypothetical protein
MGASNQWAYGEVPMMQMQLRPIPGSDKYVGLSAGHHWECYGSVILIDPFVEDDDQNSTIINITPDNNGHPESGSGQHKYGSPYALSEDFFLVAHSPNNDDDYSLYTIDSAQNKTVLLAYSDVSIQSPIPVRARPKPISYDGSTDPEGEPADGVINLVNVYNTLLPFPGGTNITHLRIWEPLVKSTSYADNPNVSYATTEADWAGKNVKLLLGTVPVESDGSARFYLPANRPVYFQAIEADGTAIQTMRSDVFVVGGQKSMYCNGCHEPRHQAAVNPDQMPIAFARAPSTITPDPVLLDDSQNPSEFLSFPRHIQPILDSKCISCHDGSPAPDLRQGSTNGTTLWFDSYYELKNYVWLVEFEYPNPGSSWNQTYPRTEPGKYGAKGSALYTKLETGHGSLTADELHTIIIWLDSGTVQYFGAYTDVTGQNAGNIVEPAYH